MTSQRDAQKVDWTEIRTRLLPDDAESLLPQMWKMPVLPHSVSQFLLHANRPNYDTKVLTRILEEDTTLTCELLKHVNSSAYGLRHRITSVRMALTALGIRRVKMLVLTTAVQSTVRKFNSHLFDLHQFWADNLERAKFAREIARTLNVDPDLSFTGAMLQDFLLPVLSHAQMKDYVSYWENPDRRSADLVDYEQSRFGVNHAQVAGICLLKWNVPDELVCAALCHHMDYHQLETMGLLGTHIHAVAASSLIPVRIPQHRTPAIPLSEWDQNDSSFELFQIAEKVDEDYLNEGGSSNRQPLADRIEHCLTKHLRGGTIQETLINRQFGNFVLEHCIGIGASGSIFRARHKMMDRPAAVKVLNNLDLSPADISRFEREVQLTSRLTHPNTISIYDFDRTDDGLFYYAMEYIRGLSLKQLVQLHGPQPAGRVIHILTQICGSLDEAHRNGLIHRDIKPENIAISQRGPHHDHVTVLDFGLVVDLQDESPVPSKGISGTPLYMAPEAIDSPGSGQTASDLYAIGAVGYYLLTAQPLYTGNDAIDICLKQLSEVPLEPSKRLGQPIAADVESLIMQCLDKSPQKRPKSAMDLARQLTLCHDAPNWTPDLALNWWNENADLHPFDQPLQSQDATMIVDMGDTV